MNICMVLEGYFPPDIRVEKEVRALLDAKHNVYLLSRGNEKTQVVEESENFYGLQVIRVNPPESFRLGRFVWFNLFFYSFSWKKALENVITRYEIEAVHVHDLPLVKTATSVAQKFNIPVIADLHENMPEAVKAFRTRNNTLRKKISNLIFPVSRWKRLEKMILKRVKYVVTVVEEAKEHYINDCNIPPEKIVVVMNTEDLSFLDNIKIDKSLVASYKDALIISYIGSFYGHHRGLDTAIKALPILLERVPNSKLLIVGYGPKNVEEELKKICEQSNVKDNVVFTGRVPFELVPTYIALSDVGLVPHHASGHTNTTIPHKLFQYMAMKKPVIVTDCKPLKRIVEECDCGLVVPSGDYKEMAEAAIKLYNDRELATKLGANGRNAVEVNYNWENEAKKLCELYERLEK